VTVRSGVAARVDPVGGQHGEAVRYLPCGEDRIFAVHHPAHGPALDVAVLICAPFGWEEVCAHRILREWAGRLAQAGHGCLRWTLPGAGDSTGSPRDEALLERWIAATEAAARWLRQAAGARSVVAIGLGLGGMLAARATAAGAPIDGLVLWGVPCRGRDFVRQLRAFSKLESSEFYIGLDAPPPLEEGALEAGGFLLAPSTAESLRGLDLSQGPPLRAPLGALVLDRDGVAADGRLLAALDAAAIETATAPGSGYAAMTSHPQTSVVPEEVLATTARWLRARSAPATPPPRLPAFEERIAVPGTAATEAPFVLELDGGTLRGIVIRHDSPGAPLCAVFLNAGAQRRIGPNRMWVEAARRWAPAGVASLRLDMLGIGEADGPATPYARDMTLYGPEFAPRVTAVLDELQRRGVADRFVLIGLCAGAYWALHAGLEDDRVAGIMMLNPVAVIWHDELGAARDLRRVFTDRSWRLIRKNATRQRLRAVARMLARAPGRMLGRLRTRGGGFPSLEMEIRRNLDRWDDPARRTMAMFAHREGLAMDLERSGELARLQSLPNVTVRRLPINDHTLRPLAIQRLVHEELDAELRRILTGAAASR
jgi:pimeloyl-ACP methyl ester carboxylesterase